MRGISVISLIAFCVLALFVNDYGVTKGHSVKDYLRGLFVLKSFTNLRHGILPGTLWCGRGNIARDDSELGMYSEMDKCCRAHDRCEDYIRPKTTKYGLYNANICRSSLCECELQFYDCLKQIRGFYPYAVRKVYFKRCKQCFRTFYDPQECINEGLDIIEEMDRKGRRVFCAKFDRVDPKSGHRHNITTPKTISATEVSTWDDEDDEYTLSRFSSKDDEDDTIYDHSK
ncbi:phospholipase A2-like [Temnothorax nylanderi]|uniref:phospholipase A2-like n=1 Tax=Temnothorax nylanderi TaxID=102681 RepID=UPI003A83D5BC